MADLFDTTLVYGEFTATRRPEENPRDPRCKLHLQRICGTCAHFAGALRGAENTSLCTWFEVAAHRRASAAKCSRWTRRVANDD